VRLDAADDRGRRLGGERLPEHEAPELVRLADHGVALRREVRARDEERGPRLRRPGLQVVERVPGRIARGLGDPRPLAQLRGELARAGGELPGLPAAPVLLLAETLGGLPGVLRRAPAGVGPVLRPDERALRLPVVGPVLRRSACLGECGVEVAQPVLGLVVGAARRLALGRQGREPVADERRLLPQLLYPAGEVVELGQDARGLAVGELELAQERDRPLVGRRQRDRPSYCGVTR
jgi:hypothetical protein